MTDNLDALSETRKSLQASPKDEADGLSRIGARKIGLAAADEMTQIFADSYNSEITRCVAEAKRQVASRRKRRSRPPENRRYMKGQPLA